MPGAPSTQRGSATRHGVRRVVVLPEAMFAPGHLIRVVQQVHVRLWAATVPGGLTSQQYMVMYQLACRPRLRQGVVGVRGSLDKATLADIVARLVRHGLVEREPAPRDTRSNVLRLSERGTKVFRRATPHVVQVQRQLAAPLTDIQRDRLVGLLRRVAAGRTGSRSSETPPSFDTPPSFGSTDAVRPGVPSEAVFALGHLVRVAQQTHTRLWSTTVPYRLTPPQYAVLDSLAREPDMDQRTLADRVRLDKAPAGEIVARLIRRDLLDRTRDPADGRRYRLRLSDHGTDVYEEVTGFAVRVQQRLTEPLDDPDRDELLALLDSVARSAAQGRAAGSAAGSPAGSPAVPALDPTSEAP